MSDLEQRVIVLEHVVKELLRQLASAEAKALKASQDLARLRGQVGG